LLLILKCAAAVHVMQGRVAVLHLLVIILNEVHALYLLDACVEVSGVFELIVQTVSMWASWISRIRWTLFLDPILF